MRTYSDYTVGLISALPLELAASMAMLDGEPHPPLSPRSLSDQNIYTLGNISGHNVVLACLPAGHTGIHNASTVAAQMRSTFESIRFGLMVGVGGGVPSEGHDIRLGDVVVSKPSGQFGGVVQYDFGKTVESGLFERTGSLNAPPRVLLNAVNALIARHELGRSTFADILTNAKLPSNFSRPGEEDRLFEAKYDHEGGGTCQHCNLANVVNRSRRDNPRVHYGTIGCANRVMKDGASRERLRQDYNILCFEMEAAGLMNDFPCLVIRGICDYADSHKNHRWQRYAAAVAAAYAKELLSIIPTSQVAETPIAQHTTYAPIESLSLNSSIEVPSPSVESTPSRADTDDLSKRLEFSFLTGGCLGPNEAALGRLVLNLDAPADDYCPHEPVTVLRQMVSIVPFPDIASLLAQRNKSRLAILLSTLFQGNSPGITVPESVARSAKTSRLLNSGAFFKQLLQNEDTRRWLETVHKKRDVYLAVGIHSFLDMPGSVSDDSSDIEGPFSTPGNRIIGVRYRRVRIKRVDSSEGYPPALTYCARWKRYIGNPDRTSGEPDCLEATLDVESPLKDLMDDFEDIDIYHSDETGENFVSLVCSF